MQQARDFWQAVYDRFDPEEPPPAHWAVDRPNSLVTYVDQALRRPFGEKRFLIFGTVGTGKTTELLKIASRQTDQQLTVFIDLWRHFSESVGSSAALEHVQPWEVLLLIGLGVYRTAVDRLGHQFAPDDLTALERAAERFVADQGPEPTVDIPQLAGALAVLAGGPVGGLAGAGLTALGTAARGMKWTLKMGLPGRSWVSDQDERVQELLAVVNRIIAIVSSEYRPIVVLVDGLDRILDPATTRVLFAESTVLGDLACALVLTAPIALRRSRLAAQVRAFFEPVVLGNIPVLDQRDPRLPGPGIPFLVRVFRRRLDGLPAPEGLEDVEACIAQPYLEQLAYFSGGRVRGYIRFLRMVAERAWDQDVPTATQAMVDEVIDQRRRIQESGLHRAHVDLLRSLMRDQERLLPNAEEVHELLDQWCLLPFPNETEWYYPHPLLTMRLLTLEPGSES